MSQILVTGEAKIRDIQGPVVANDGVITALDGAASQYVRGDGTLADFPTSSGGGSSVSYYLNSSVSQGTIGGVAYRELSKDPIIGGGTDIAISSNGYVANYITDVNDPDVTIVPGGNFNCEFYFSVNNNTGNPTTYAELYKYDGTTFTLLGSSAGVPESINQGTIVAPYYFAIPVPTSTLALTDRLAIRIYVNVDGRTVTLHTENGHLCQVVTTFSKGMLSMNNLTDQSQYLTTGTAGTNFAIASSGDTHTFNLPVASATNTGKLSSTDWSTFNGKVPYTGAISSVDLGVYSITSNAVKAIGDNLTYGGVVSIKQNNVIGGLIGTGYTELFGKTNSLGISFGSGSIAYLSNSVLTADRTFTLPDASGTLALTSNLSSYVPYTGATGDVNLGAFDLTATGITANSFYAQGNGTQGGYLYLKQGIVPYGTLAGSNSISADGTKYIYLSDAGSNNSKTAIFQLGSISNNIERTFTLPDLSGTLALLEGSQTFSGNKTFSALTAFTFANGTRMDYGLYLSKGAVPSAFTSLTTNIYSDATTNNIVIRDNSSIAKLEFNNSTQTYTFPAATGTIALTSNLSAYLPLAGGTLTGALSGTSATFTSAGTLGTQIQLAGTTDSAGIKFTPLTGNTWEIQANTSNQFFVYNRTNSFYALTIASTGAATFSSSVTTNANNYFNNTSGRAFDATSDGVLMAKNGGAHNIIFGDGNVRYYSLYTPSGAAYGSIRNFSTSTDILSFTSGGNVGIGTGSPSAALDIDRAEGIMMRVKRTGVAGEFQMYQGPNVVYLDSAAASGNLAFATVGTERMRITSGGSVNIGMTSNNYAILGVKSNTATSYGGFNVYANSNDRFIALNHTGSVGVIETENAGSGVMTDLTFKTGGAERMRIASGGNVCIGTTTVNDKLTIDGGIRSIGSSSGYFWNDRSNAANFYGWYATSNVVYFFNGSANAAQIIPSTGVYTPLSDVNKKKDFEVSEIGLNQILNLKPTLYRMKSDKTNGNKELGFIAQEVKKFIPQAYVESKDFIGLNYNAIVAALVKSVQELKAEIDELKNK